MLACQRDKFTIPDEVAYFNCAFTAPLLKAAQEAGRAAVAQKGAPWTYCVDDFFVHAERARELFARLVHAAPDDVALVPSVSYGAAVAAANLTLRPGGSVVMLEEQFPSHVYSWQALARRHGAEVRTVPKRPAEPWTQGVLDAIDEHTGLVAVPHCHWTDGSLLDLAAVGRRCRETGAVLAIDGTQSVGALPFDVTEIKPDFLFVSGHKWMLGPYALSYLYAAPKWHQGKPLEENWMNRAGSENLARLADYRDGYQPGARRFDMGEASNFLLLPVAIAALEQLLEWETKNIAETLAHTTARIAQGARDLGLAVAPDHARGPHLMGIGIPTERANQIAERLKMDQVYVSIRGDSIRIGPHLYNTATDIDRLLTSLGAAL